MYARVAANPMARNNRRRQRHLEPESEHSFFRTAAPTKEDLQRFHCREERKRFVIILM